ADEFDWRAQERELNAVNQFQAELDGVHIHFVHERARHGHGIPLILTHGWPSTFVELLPLVPFLTDPDAHGIDGPAFDVVIPSLPGYGFSDRPAGVRVNYQYVAGLWHRLMRGLGYERYGAQGGDFGAGIATIMELENPKPMIVAHLRTLEIAAHTRSGSGPRSAAARTYLEVNAPSWMQEFVDVPTGIAVFANNFVDEGTPPREWAERLYNVRRWTPMPRGGHFAAAEEPELLARDIAAFFAGL